MKVNLPNIQFCPACGGELALIDTEGRDRPVCTDCGHIVYINPIPAIALVVIDEQRRVLLVLRSVEPKKGDWCLPGGFLEWGEHPKEGGARELFEETGVTAGEMELVGAYDSVTGTCRHVLVLAYRVKDWSGEEIAGDDADAVAWYSLDDMPKLAFDNHELALKDAFDQIEKNM